MGHVEIASIGNHEKIAMYADLPTSNLNDEEIDSDEIVTFERVDEDWKEKYFSVNKRLDELILLLADKNKQLIDVTEQLEEKNKQLDGAKKQIIEMGRLARKCTAKNKKLRREVSKYKQRQQPSFELEHLKNIFHIDNSEAQGIEVLYNEEVTAVENNTTFKNTVSSQSPLKQNHTFEIFQLFEDEDRLVNCFVQADFLDLIEKHDLNYAIKIFYNKMFNKNPGKLQIEMIKNKWGQNEYGYKILIEIAKKNKANEIDLPQENNSNYTHLESELAMLKQQMKEMQKVMTSFVQNSNK